MNKLSRYNNYDDLKSSEITKPQFDSINTELIEVFDILKKGMLNKKI